MNTAALKGKANLAVRILAVLTLAGAAAARPPADNQIEPTERAAENILKMEIVALNSSGEPATDLLSSDLQLFDDGSIQTIAFCRNNGKRAPQPATLAPHEFSNQTVSTLQFPTVILVDLLNLRTLSASRSAEQIVRSLDRLQSTENFYIYLLGCDRTVEPVRPVPKSESDLRVLEPWTKSVGATLDRAIRNAAGTSPPDELRVRIRTTLQALMRIANEMSAIPGRKNIIWLTSGVASAYGWVDFLPWLREVAGILNQGRIAMYSIDRFPLNADTNPNVSLDTPRQLSALTGGRSYRGDHIEDAIAQTAVDVRASYLIGYYPQRWDGKYHKIRINCVRKGVRIHAMEGYYAEVPKSTAEELQGNNFHKAWQSLFDVSDIGLRIAVSPSVKNQQTVHFRIRLDPADLMLLRQGDHYISHLAFEFAGYTDAGPMEPSVPFPVTLTITDKQRIDSATNVTELEQDLAFGDSTRKVRVMVIDRGSNAIGSLTVPVR